MYQSPNFIKVETNVKDVFKSYCQEKVHFGGSDSVLGTCIATLEDADFTFSYPKNPDDWQVKEMCFVNQSATGY